MDLFLEDLIYFESDSQVGFVWVFMTNALQKLFNRSGNPTKKEVGPTRLWVIYEGRLKKHLIDYSMGLNLDE